MAHTIYENFVLENKLDNMLTTAIDMNAYITADYSLTESAGMKKVINTYTATGNVEDLAMGEGNTEDIEVSFTTAEYEVETTQGKFAYYDEQEMTDPMVVETGLKGIADKLTNDLVAKAVAEWEKGTLAIENATFSFDNVVDAIGLLNLEDESGLFLMISPADKAKVRKALGEDLKYSEGFARTGYIGSVCGVPVIVSKAIPAGKGYLASKDAVYCFVKKGVEIEQERDADTRQNIVFGRKVMLVALKNASKVVKLVAAAADSGSADDNGGSTDDNGGTAGDEGGSTGGEETTE